MVYDRAVRSVDEIRFGESFARKRVVAERILGIFHQIGIYEFNLFFNAVHRFCRRNYFVELGFISLNSVINRILVHIFIDIDGINAAVIEISHVIPCLRSRA